MNETRPESRLWWRVMLPLFGAVFALGLITAWLPGAQKSAFGENYYTVIGVVSGISGVISFLLAPAIGRMSDRWGRKYFILVASLAAASPACSLIFGANLWVYEYVTLAASPLSMMFALSFAYIGDVSHGRERASRFGVVTGMIGVSLIIGPLAGAGIVRAGGPDWLFRIVCGVTALTVLLVVFFVPETIQYSRHNDGTYTKVLPLESSSHHAENDTADELNAPLLADRSGETGPTKDDEHTATSTAISGSFSSNSEVAIPARSCLSDVFVNPFTALKPLFVRPLLKRVSCVLFFVDMAEASGMALVLPYLTGRFDTGSTANALFISGLGIAIAFSQGVVLRPLLKRYSERSVARIAICCQIIDLIVYGFAWKLWMVYCNLVFVGLASLSFPAMAAIVSKTSRPEEAALNQGCLTGVKSLTTGIGPTVFGLLLTACKHSTTLPEWLQGVPFLVNAAGVAISLATLIWYLPQEMIDSQTKQVQEYIDKGRGLCGDAVATDSKDSELKSSCADEEGMAEALVGVGPAVPGIVVDPLLCVIADEGESANGYRVDVPHVGHDGGING